MLSVVIPTLNAARVLPGCLASLRGAIGVEVLVMDGGSTDGTLDIARAAGARVFENCGGIYKAMNAGVCRSKGDWLYFLGADDRLCADAFTVLRAGGDDIVQGFVTSGGNRYSGSFELDSLMFAANVPHQSLFYRRDLFHRIGWFNVRYPLWADWDFNVRCAMHGGLVVRSTPAVIAEVPLGGVGNRGFDAELAKWLPAARKYARRG